MLRVNKAIQLLEYYTLEKACGLAVIFIPTFFARYAESVGITVAKARAYHECSTKYRVARDADGFIEITTPTDKTDLAHIMTFRAGYRVKPEDVKVGVYNERPAVMVGRNVYC